MGSKPETIAGAAPVITERVRLRDGVHAATTKTGTVHLVRWPKDGGIGVPTPAQRAALRCLAGREYRPDELRDEVDPAAGAEIDDLVDRLRAGGWLDVTVLAGDRELYTLDTLAAQEGEPPAPPRRPVLSRLAVLRREAARMVLAMPRAPWEVRLHDPRLLAMLGTLTGEFTGPDRAAAAGLEPVVADRFLDDLARGGYLNADGDIERAGQWSGHDLWFHANSRMGTRKSAAVDAFGKTRWISADSGRLPPFREPFGGPTIPLAHPDLDMLRETDPSFTEVVEASRSVREHDHDNPITAEQLGEFLYRCARARTRHGQDGEPATDRPYPSGGSSYELEFYPLVHRVAGLEPGLYHYEPGVHRLERVPADPAAVHTLSGTARSIQRLEQPPQVLIVLSARFGRVMREYQGIGYSLILKHVGVVFQLMYTVATAMGLAPCALGAGDAETFSAAVGVNYHTESSVGEFLLGSAPSEAGGR